MTHTKHIIKTLILTTFAVITTIISNPSKVIASEGDIWLSPTVINAKSGGSFDIEVHVDTGGKNLGPFDIYFDFNTSDVSIDTSQGTDGVDVGDDGAGYDPPVVNSTDLANGHLRIAGFISSGFPNGTDVHILTIHAQTTSSFTSGTSDLDLRITDLADEYANPLSSGTVTGATVAALAPVYRFWSDTKQGHFYTISESEKNHVIAVYPTSVWNYEGIAFYANTESTSENSPVYRFWSDTKQGHFYTISEAEKDNVIATYPTSVWNYEGIAFYAYTSSTSTNSPVYRFWSDTKQHHFYTISESEKNHVIAVYPTSVWNYEWIGFYAFE